MANIKDLVGQYTICAVCGESVNRSDIEGWMFSPHDTHVPTLGICHECFNTLSELVKERK